MGRFAPAIVVLFFACGGGASAPSTTPAASGDPCAAGDPCGGDRALDISGWDQWTKISEAPFKSGGHNGGWADIYVSPDHADAYRALQGPMPEGLKVAKIMYTDESANKIKVVQVMSKMAAGYDVEHNDWYYGIYSPDGSKAMKHGKLKACIGCHEADEDTDYVSGVPE